MNRRSFLFVGGSAAVSGFPARGAPVDLGSGRQTKVEIVACPDESRQLRLVRDTSGRYAASGEYESSPLRVDGRFRLRWTPQWVTPQRYRKHSANPIYGPEQSGEWDKWTNGVGILRTPDNKGYRMYYADQTNGIGFAEASISEPTKWKENPVSPVLRPLGEPTWEGARLNQPRMARVNETHWRMYYTGWGQEIWRMGLAESFDAGKTWKRYSNQPILPLGQKGEPDSGAACVPMVLRHEGVWRMWYTATEERSKGIHICYAVSEDGIHWRKHSANPVLSTIPGSTWETAIVSRPCVLVEDGIFKMWYSMRGPKYRIGYAESIDGIRWERSPLNPILDVSKSGWDSEMVEYPEVDRVGGIYRMWYCGNGFGTVGYSEGEPETRLEISTRTGASAKPDDRWSQWSALYDTPLGQASLSPTAPFLQVRVRFSTSNPALSPSLRALEIL